MDGKTVSAIDSETRQIIEDFVVDSAHMVDDDRLEDWPEYFTETCTYRIINRKNYALGRSVGVMECSSRGMLEDRVKALREANVYEPHSYRHLLSGIRIRDQSDGIYRVETSFVVVRTMQEGEMSLFASGKYIDDINVTGRMPKFKSRIVVCDSVRVHTLVVIPL